MNKPTRLRTILVGHMKRMDIEVPTDRIDALEADIKTFVKSILNGASELGLKVECEDYIGDLN